MDGAVGHTETAHIPQAGTGGGFESTLAAGDVLALPQDVLPGESAVDGIDTAALFESGFALAYGDLLQTEVATVVERALAGKGLIRDLHGV